MQRREQVLHLLVRLTSCIHMSSRVEHMFCRTLQFQAGLEWLHGMWLQVSTEADAQSRSGRRPEDPLHGQGSFILESLKISPVGQSFWKMTSTASNNPKVNTRTRAFPMMLHLQ
ncbi:uncharacterized protein HMPREF1120_09235 [Exophiala dermatitidis NIH/UT8656]|uniref:Uncharacterized protein n=1 Tax=Exophiala dermatitidis (strain ATCC 34100 / CBS 525.76 / NIH/UT8656) TaxID=858893 RepID=H6CC04_EXODN|nr:uncharacterized protein HMPREF1120_09235 [Exophiala dermatitidis NIH/UT8656]EHY61301.1 hypothetical protein HMPREF1120_09235 [Exophiala dermatitidis NIH/UT8656]